jgi:N-carbamoyl-D-amino-acid hydrolase
LSFGFSPVPRPGKQDGFGLIGGSATIVPTGEIAARALGEDDEVISAMLDFDFGDYIKRPISNSEKHRRIEHCRLITERTGARIEV